MESLLFLGVIPEILSILVMTFLETLKLSAIALTDAPDLKRETILPLLTTQ
jgi:hypothetical protein